MNGSNPKRPECDDISPLIPWYVNGTLPTNARQRVEIHAAHCEGCGRELADDQSLYRMMNIELSVEVMPATSLKRLLARLDEGQDEGDVAAPPEKVGYRPSNRRMLVAVAAVVLAVGAFILGMDRWMLLNSRPSEHLYYTVTEPRPNAPGAVIRAVFVPGSTLDDVQVVLAEAGLQIVAGPTEAGVYTLSANSGHNVDVSLGIMRANAKIRFAERVQWDSRRGDRP